LYFERGTDIKSLGIEECVTNVQQDVHFHVTPSITADFCTAVFDVPDAGRVHLVVYDVTGRYVDEVYTGTVTQGRQTIDVPVSHLSNGTYFAVLETTAGRQTAKFTVVR